MICVITNQILYPVDTNIQYNIFCYEIFMKFCFLCFASSFKVVIQKFCSYLTKKKFYLTDIFATSVAIFAPITISKLQNEINEYLCLLRGLIQPILIIFLTGIIEDM